MYHHDNRNYAVAASEAATKTRAKFEALIEKGERSAAVVIEQIMGSRPIYHLRHWRTIEQIASALRR